MRLQNELKTIGSPILAYVNTRYDSNRFAYHGTTPVIHAKSRKITKLVTKSKEDVGSLWILEDARTDESFQSLDEVGLVLGEVVHDDKLLVDFIY
jgi:hypothetical protein